MACHRSRPSVLRTPCGMARSTPRSRGKLAAVRRSVREVGNGALGRRALAVSSALVVPIAVALSTASHAREEARPLGIERAEAIESCVSGTPIRFQAQDRRALLDAADAAAVTAAITQRYPVLERDGL